MIFPCKPVRDESRALWPRSRRRRIERARPRERGLAPAPPIRSPEGDSLRKRSLSSPAPSAPPPHWGESDPGVRRRSPSNSRCIRFRRYLVCENPSPNLHRWETAKHIGFRGRRRRPETSVLFQIAGSIGRISANSYLPCLLSLIVNNSAQVQPSRSPP